MGHPNRRKCEKKREREREKKERMFRKRNEHYTPFLGDPQSQKGVFRFDTIHKVYIPKREGVANQEMTSNKTLFKVMKNIHDIFVHARQYYIECQMYEMNYRGYLLRYIEQSLVLSEFPNGLTSPENCHIPVDVRKMEQHFYDLDGNCIVLLFRRPKQNKRYYQELIPENEDGKKWIDRIVKIEKLARITFVLVSSKARMTIKTRRQKLMSKAMWFYFSHTMKKNKVRCAIEVYLIYEITAMHSTFTRDYRNKSSFDLNLIINRQIDLLLKNDKNEQVDILEIIKNRRKNDEVDDKMEDEGDESDDVEEEEEEEGDSDGSEDNVMINTIKVFKDVKFIIGTSYLMTKKNVSRSLAILNKDEIKRITMGSKSKHFLKKLKRSDTIARILGANIGDVVKTKMSHETCGKSCSYRIVISCGCTSKGNRRCAGHS